MHNLYNFALKTEAVWVKRVVKHIVETRNVNDVYTYLCFTLPDTKYLFWILKNK